MCRALMWLSCCKSPLNHLLTVLLQLDMENEDVIDAMVEQSTFSLHSAA